MIIFRIRARRYEVKAEDFLTKLKSIIEKRRPADDNGKAISKCAHRSFGNIGGNVTPQRPVLVQRFERG
jgi:hypothetical protein